MERILVGVDGSSSSIVALRWALDLAGLTGAALEVLYARPASPPVAGGEPPDLAQWEAAADAAARQKLDEIVDGVLAGKPDYVDIARMIVPGPPARTLIDHAKGADVLVVGSRGLGGFTGLLLGSVSQQCAQHAQIPVVVVPEPE